MLDNTPNLPQKYKLTYMIDYKGDGKLALLLNFLVLLLVAALVGLALLFNPFTIAFTEENASTQQLVAFGVFIVLIFISIHVHEMIHAYLFKKFSGQKPFTRFRMLSALSGMPNYYFNKKSYTVIILTPVAILNLLLILPLFFSHGAWFWIFYIAWMLCITVCTRDVYTFYKLRDMSDEVLVQDDCGHVKFYMPLS